MSNGKRSYGVLSSVIVVFLTLILVFSCVGSYIWFIYGIWEEFAIKRILG